MAHPRRHWIFLNVIARAMGVCAIIGGLYVIYHGATLHPEIAAGITSTLFGSAARDYTVVGSLVAAVGTVLLLVRPIDSTSDAWPRTLNSAGNWLTGMPHQDSLSRE